MDKICTKCGGVKNHSEFGKHKNAKDGLQSWCKKCNYNQRKKHNFDNKKYYQENSTQINLKRKEWISKNLPPKPPKSSKTIEEKKEYHRKYQQQRYENPLKRISNTIKCSIRRGCKNIGAVKNKRSLTTVGLDSWDKLREHIESQWTEGMTWDNHGQGKNNTTWHIDHIIPISLAKTEEEVYKLNHYTNLRPMWGSDNIRKSNK